MCACTCAAAAAAAAELQLHAAGAQSYEDYTASCAMQHRQWSLCQPCVPNSSLGY